MNTRIENCKDNQQSVRRIMQFQITDPFSDVLFFTVNTRHSIMNGIIPPKLAIREILLDMLNDEYQKKNISECLFYLFKKYH